MTDHKQAAIEAGAKALPGVPANDEEVRLMQNTARAVIAAALPHLRAMIAQEIFDYWEACGELIDTHNGARLAFDAIAAQIAEGPQQ